MICSNFIKLLLDMYLDHNVTVGVQSIFLPTQTQSITLLLNIHIVCVKM